MVITIMIAELVWTSVSTVGIRIEYRHSIHDVCLHWNFIYIDP